MEMLIEDNKNLAEIKDQLIMDVDGLGINNTTIMIEMLNEALGMTDEPLIII